MLAKAWGTIPLRVLGCVSGFETLPIEPPGRPTSRPAPGTAALPFFIFRQPGNVVHVRVDLLGLKHDVTSIFRRSILPSHAGNSRIRSRVSTHVLGGSYSPIQRTHGAMVPTARSRERSAVQNSVLSIRASTT